MKCLRQYCQIIYLSSIPGVSSKMAEFILEEYQNLSHLLNKYKDLGKFDFTTLFVIGMPQETHESLKATTDIILDLKLDKIAMGFAIPYPGTKLFEVCKRDNLFMKSILGAVRLFFSISFKYDAATPIFFANSLWPILFLILK